MQTFILDYKTSSKIEYFHVEKFVLNNQNLYIISFSDCAVTITQSLGVITSPGFPQPYRNGIDCTWNIHLSIGQMIQYNFLYFDVEYSSGCIW